MTRVTSHGRSHQFDGCVGGLQLDGTHFWIGGGGTVLATRTVRNVQHGHHTVGLIVDDLVSFDPFTARGIRIYGTAEEPTERVGMVGPGHHMRVTPTASWSWNTHASAFIASFRRATGARPRRTSSHDTVTVGPNDGVGPVSRSPGRRGWPSPRATARRQ